MSFLVDIDFVMLGIEVNRLLRFSSGISFDLVDKGGADFLTLL